MEVIVCMTFMGSHVSRIFANTVLHFLHLTKPMSLSTGHTIYFSLLCTALHHCLMVIISWNSERAKLVVYFGVFLPLPNVSAAPCCAVTEYVCKHRGIYYPYLHSQNLPLLHWPWLMSLFCNYAFSRCSGGNAGFLVTPLQSEAARATSCRKQRLMSSLDARLLIWWKKGWS